MTQTSCHSIGQGSCFFNQTQKPGFRLDFFFSEGRRYNIGFLRFFFQKWFGSFFVFWGCFTLWIFFFEFVKVLGYVGEVIS